jgi:hypothetical protein
MSAPFYEAQESRGAQVLCTQAGHEEGVRPSGVELSAGDHASIGLPPAVGRDGNETSLICFLFHSF